MRHLIVYGSLLHPEELKKHNISMDRVEFVKVKGYRRVFEQEPSWRKVDSIHRAVLNLQEDEHSWFNALLIKDLTQEYIDELDHRERGYNRIDVKKDGVVTYSGSCVDNCIVYVGKEGKQNRQILPNIEYYKICIDGAKAHFEEFYLDYLHTTYNYYKDKLTLINKE